MREKMELRTKKSAVILTACAPVALSVLPVLAISLLLLPPSFIEEAKACVLIIITLNPESDEKLSSCCRLPLL